jgi:transcriptional regulator with XRE-family HTH domain
MTQQGSIPKIDLPGVMVRLEALRAALALSKSDFAASCGLDASSYSKVLGLTKPLKSDHAYALAAAWGVTMDYFYRGDLSRIDEALRAKILMHLNTREE